MRLVIIFSLISLITNGQILKKSYHDWENTKVSEVYYVNSLGQNNGLFTKYSYDGAKGVEANFKNGVMQGAAKEFYTRGPASKLKISGNYKDGEKHGLFITYTYVKYNQSYFEILKDLSFNDKEEDIFKTGVQTKYKEETFDMGNCIKETQYHITGKPFYTANFDNRRYTGEYICYNEKNVVIAKGKIGPNGKMVGLWVIPREESGDCPKNKHEIDKVTYTQKIKFDENGNVDSSYYSKSYSLTGKLRDSVRVTSLEYTSGYDWSGIWYLCGKNKSMNGPYKRFNENGKLLQEGNYKSNNGKAIETGIWKFYNTDGALSEEKDFNKLIIEEKIEPVKKDTVKKTIQFSPY